MQHFFKIILIIVLFFNVQISYPQPLIAVCENVKTITFAPNEEVTVPAVAFDGGSTNNGNPMYFKVLKVNENLVSFGGCPSESSGNQSSWFSDEVHFCGHDTAVVTNVLVILRVFNVDPGAGPVDPARMIPGGDLYSHFVDCYTVIVYETIFPPLAVCLNIGTITIPQNGEITVPAVFFDPEYDYGHPVFFKAQKVNENLEYYGGCPSDSSSSHPSWFSDEVHFCWNDTTLTDSILVNLRVFNVDPGAGPVDPERMISGGDLYSHFADCYTVIQIDNLNPPIAVCDGYRTITIPQNGEVTVPAAAFEADYGNSYPLFYKAAKVNENFEFYGGCPSYSPGNQGFWFSDEVYFCSNDITLANLTFVILRVFNIDPGVGPVDSTRMLPDGDLYSHFNECYTIINYNYSPPCQPENIIAGTKAYTCEADINVPALNCLEDTCGATPKWWVTTTEGLLFGDSNQNGFVDADETWIIKGAPLGTFYLCYHILDNCGNTEKKCVIVTVKDNTPPITVCEQFKEVSVSENGQTKVNAKTFDAGSFDNCSPVWFKALRVSNINLGYDGGCKTFNGDDNPDNNFPDITWDVWYDDEVIFCNEDIGKDVMVTLRVFDKNPGTGPVEPKRMLPGGDLYSHFNDCWNMTKVKSGTNSGIICENLQLANNVNLDPFQNQSLIPEITCSSDYELFYYDQCSEKCSNTFTRKWTVVCNSYIVTCEQEITIDSIPKFDPCSIVLPKSKTVNCLEEINISYPYWDAFVCNNISANIIEEDTLENINGLKYKITRQWVIIDSCLYQHNTGAENNIDIVDGNSFNCQLLQKDGYYRYTQTLNVRDTLITFDPCSIVFPEDITTECGIVSPEDNKPVWDNNGCIDVEAVLIGQDTFKFTNGACYYIERDWAVIDWNKYLPNTGAELNVDKLTGNKLNCSSLIEDGYYRYTQGIYFSDFTSPKILINAGQCIAPTDCKARDLKIDVSAYDDCGFEQKFFWKYIVTNLETNEVIQYSYNYLPKPAGGIQGDKTKDNLDKVKNAFLKIDQLGIGNYKIVWTVGDQCGNSSTAEQYFSIKDKTTPTPQLVDIATIIVDNGIAETKAIWFDKGGCGQGCIGSFDNCTPSSGLYFTFTPVLPDFENNPSQWSQQLAQYGKNFFDPNTGNISTNDAFLAGDAHAWYPENKSSSKIWLDDDAGNTENVNIYVWDQFAYDEDCDNNNSRNGVVFVNIIKGQTLNNNNTNINFKLYQNEPNPFSHSTKIGFDLGYAQNYKISIFDISGKELKTFENSGREGYNSIMVNKDELPHNGMLYYKFETEGFTETKKMIVF